MFDLESEAGYLDVTFSDYTVSDSERIREDKKYKPRKYEKKQKRSKVCSNTTTKKPVTYYVVRENVTSKRAYYFRGMCSTGPWTEDIRFAIPYSNPTAADYAVKMLYP